ncbi:MAG: cytochrome c biogenesis protein ResB [Desulfobulbaceae bacterium]
MAQRTISFARRVLDGFTSTGVALGLFALLICLLVPATFFPDVAPALLKPARALLAVIGLNLLLCTLRRLKTLRVATLLIHLGALVILGGSLISALGFIATVNIYEESSTDTVFNWDREQDVDLGFDLRVARINMAFYPVDVKVGILKNGQKAELVLTRTGDSFGFEGYRVQVLTLEPGTNELELEIRTAAGNRVGTLSTSGRRDLPLAFPLDFQLVAFKDPVVKRVWVDLEIRENGKLLASGTSEVNRPLRWQSLQFFLTRVDADGMGRGYAGIQISRDPGIPFVYTGFIILCLGLLLALKGWVAPGGTIKA